MNELINLVVELSNNYSSIIRKEILNNYAILSWGNNGVGDRWAHKKFNYTVLYSGNKMKTYSENEENTSNIDTSALMMPTQMGIIGIFVHSTRKNIERRPIRKDIKDYYKQCACVSCGTMSDLICDHKNDLYNESRVLNRLTQTIHDFQSLCNHCNLQKRQIAKIELHTLRLYSAKNIPSYAVYPISFPWEVIAFIPSDINAKKHTYWYDPIEFNRKIYIYIRYVQPILHEIKRIKLNS